MRAMFFEALQSYYAPATALLIFAAILIMDQLLTWREKRLFLIELGLVGLMILTTWADRCVSAVAHGNWWRLRFVTSALQFAVAPVSPLILLRIYRRNQPSRWTWLMALPAVVTAILSLSSIWTGLVLRVEPGNIYTRGPLFFLPFFASAIYLAFMVKYAFMGNMPGRRYETGFLLLAGMVIAWACTLEIIFVIRYMIWSTTAAMQFLYFLVVTNQKLLYDPQTGTYSRLAYTKRLASIREGQPITLAMVDMNGLKAINDRYGHKAGDQAILQVAQALLALPTRGKKLYRYGGDEFVIVVKGGCGRELERDLKQAVSRCGKVEECPLSFAYGVLEHPGGDLHKTMEEIDRRMYRMKREMKGIPEEASDQGQA